jgi:5'-deoxynucleotidase YfbR-like HD superfamily hydrolase
MSKPKVDDLNKLVKEVIIPFYRIERHVQFGFRGGQNENDAEHSWMLALVACALAPSIDSKLDVGKICQFAIVHDLVEIHAGDTSNFADEKLKATKQQREDEALLDLRKELKKFPWIINTIEEYEKQSSSEAIFTRSVDKFLPLLFDYSEEGLTLHHSKITKDIWINKLQIQREKASKHPGAFEYYDEIWNLLLANPQFFYQESN